MSTPPSSAPPGGSSIVTPAIACDDLSGACEVAGVLHAAGVDTTVELVWSGDERSAIGTAPTGSAGRPARVKVLDLAVREATDDAARQAITQAISTRDVRYVKIDSLLRGPVRGLVDGAAAAGRRRLLCPALPVAGRTVVRGVPLIDGSPLRDSEAWRAESTPAPARVADLLDPMPCIELVVASEPPADLVLAQPGPVLCADASTEDDLELIADLVLRHGLLPIGSAGLLIALMRRQTADRGSPPVRAAPVTRRSDPDETAVIVAVGTASSVAHHQVELLRAEGAIVVDLDLDCDDESVDASIAAQLDGHRTVVVRWSPRIEIDASRSSEMAERFSALVAVAAATRPGVPVVLTGGQTARAVLCRLGVRQLSVASIVDHGAVVLTCDDGRVAAIRPGSFGDPTSLIRLRHAVTSLTQEELTS